MQARSIKGNSPAEINTALQQSMADDFTPTLAIVFLSIKQDREGICKILREKGINIFGATTCGEFINDHQGEGSTVILLLDIDPEHYTILFEEIGDRTLNDIAGQVARAAFKKFNTPAFILCSTGISADGQMFAGGTLIRCMEKEVGQDVKIFGGMAGDDGAFSRSFVFTSERSTDLGITALILDEEKIGLYGMAISGWKPLGITRTITKCEDGWICTIDDKPALEMYLKYLGREPDAGEDKFKIFEETGVHHPFLVEEAGDPVIRTPFIINREKHAFKLDFDVPEGTKFRFSMPPDLDIVETILEKATELKNTANSDAEALLIFSCAGRRISLGPLAKLENDGLGEIWKAPMAGFFSYGEYGTSVNGRQGFHSTTCSWVALKEK